MTQALREKVARAIRRDKFARTRRLGVLDENLPLKDDELSEADAAILVCREHFAGVADKTAIEDVFPYDRESACYNDAGVAIASAIRTEGT